MIFIVFVLMALSLGILIGRNLKIIDYEIKIDKLRSELDETKHQLLRLRSMTAKAPPWKEGP